MPNTITHLTASLKALISAPDQMVTWHLQVRKGRREIELAGEGIEDDRKRLAAKEARLTELAADSQQKHHSISQCASAL